MKILNFGSCNIDYVYSLDHIVKDGETETTHDLAFFPGGKGLNQSIAVAKAGGTVFHAGCIGEDGAFLAELLAQNGVDVSNLRTVGVKNGHAVIQVNAKGENAIFLYPGSNEQVDEAFIDAVLKDFGAGDILLLQNEISHVDYIVEQAYKRGMCIVLNPSPFNARIDRIQFQKLSYLVLNEVELCGISGCKDHEDGLRYLKQAYPWLKVILTLGDKGSIFVSGTQEWRQAAFKVDTVDTTAAGDTFTGYFIAELSKGTPPAQILRLASAAAAVAVSRKGAASSIPSREELLALLETMEENTRNGQADLLIKRIESYIEPQLKTANLTELADILGYSKVYTGKLVKRSFGTSFSKLLLTKRCKAAAHMLLHTDLSVGEIIERVGYENESYFRTTFKEIYGKNPLEYRKRGMKQYD